MDGVTCNANLIMTVRMEGFAMQIIQSNPEHVLLPVLMIPIVTTIKSVFIFSRLVLKNAAKLDVPPDGNVCQLGNICRLHGKACLPMVRLVFCTPVKCCHL